MKQQLKEDYNWVLERVSKCQMCGKPHKLKWFVRFNIWLDLWDGNSKEWCLEQFIKQNWFRHNGG